jgi:hypothetical protein
MDAHLETALSTSRSRTVRLEAWVRYEAECWAQAHTDRALQMTSLPQSYEYCREIGDRIFALLEAQFGFRLIRKAASAGTADILTSS